MEAVRPDDVSAPADREPDAGGRSWSGRFERPSLPLLLAVAAAIVPWSWFAVRNLDPRLEVVAIGLPLIILGAAAALAVVGLVSRRAVVVVPLASLCVFAWVAIVAPWMPAATGPPEAAAVAVTANVGGAWGERVMGPLLAEDPDVLVVVELPSNLETELEAEFEHWHKTRDDISAERLIPSVGVYSRFPIEEATTAPDGLPGLRAVIDGPGGRFVVYGMHVPKPAFEPAGGFATTFRNHLRLVDRLAEAAAAEDLPVVLAGDLNSPDRGQSYRTLSGVLTDAARTDWTGPTSVKASLLWKLLLLRIDHLMISSTWCSADAARFAIEPSDHVGVRAEVGPCATG